MRLQIKGLAVFTRLPVLTQSVFDAEVARGVAICALYASLS
jgi:hypothetical protein